MSTPDPIRPADAITELGDELPNQVLVVTAHPDDVDFGASATVARLTETGVKVAYCIVTDGDAGDAHGIPRAEVGALRQREQRAAGGLVGVDDIHFLGLPDGMLVAGLDLRKAIARVIRQVRPDVVITQSPLRRYDFIYASHPDHLAAGEAALSAVYPDARNPHTFPELLDEGWDPHTVRRVWLMAHPEPNRFVDITETYDRKVAALRAHESQTGARSDEELDGLLRTWAAGMAKLAGWPDGRLAEGFREVITG